MGKAIKKILATVLTVALCLSFWPPINAEAAPTKWQLSDGVVAYVQDGVLYIAGEGAMPNYDKGHLYSRPWFGYEFEAIEIGDGITDIGSYAFYGMWRVKYITIPSTTFIADSTCFQGINNEAWFRIKGTDVTTRMAGTIPYTSAMSIAAQAQGNSGYAYITDNSLQFKGLLKTMTYPILDNVYMVKESDALKDRDSYTDKYFPAEKYATPCKFLSTDAAAGYTVNAFQKIQGYYCYLHLSNFLNGYTFGTAYNINVTNSKGEYLESGFDEYTYVLQIPEELQKNGRTFQVLCLVSNETGEVVTLSDIDTSGKTVTFKTDKVGVVYALIYKDPA